MGCMGLMVQTIYNYTLSMISFALFTNSDNYRLCGIDQRRALLLAHILLEFAYVGITAVVATL
jgi:hypothetical protein